MPELSWFGPQTCPRCGATVAVGFMRVSATCECGAYFADALPLSRGWYESREAYQRGEKRIAEVEHA